MSASRHPTAGERLGGRGERGGGGHDHCQRGVLVLQQVGMEKRFVVQVILRVEAKLQTAAERKKTTGEN
jgi:hypothetical protein